MTLLGWIVFSSFTLATIYFFVQLMRDFLWNRGLKKFQKTLGENIPKTKALFWIKRSYGAIVAGLFMFATVFSNTFSLPETIGDRVLLHAKSVESGEHLKQLLSTQDSLYYNLYSGVDFLVEDMINEGAPQNEEKTRDFIGTNNQVSDVEEADIIKTDGDFIYYAARYTNTIRVFEVGSQGILNAKQTIELDNLYTDSIYLTDDYLIVIGYIYNYSPYRYHIGLDYIDWVYPSYTGTVIVYELETLEIVYKLETDANFHEYRLIDQSLYLISNKYMQNDEYRPMFKSTLEDEVETFYLDYSDIYYFEGVPIYGMTIITGLDLETFEVNSQAFLGRVDHIYANGDHLYTAFNFYRSYTYTDGFIGSIYQTQIMKFAIHSNNATFEYLGQTVIDGGVQNSYWMDEHDDHLRVVTSQFNPVINRLFILKHNPENDHLDLVGSITNGLGKPGETVYSVDFQGTMGYIVTFRTIDPRYWIDLSDPTKPTILKATERLGFATYQHIWNEAGNQLISIGHTANDEGVVTGLELTATDELNDKEDSYQLLHQASPTSWMYSYSEALYNPKAMMISPAYGIVAFPVNAWNYEYLNQEYKYTYVSEYMVFFIDFNQEDENEFISEPIIISHPVSDNYASIDRGIYVQEEGETPFRVIFTFSSQGMVSYDLLEMQTLQTILF